MISHILGNVDVDMVEIHKISWLKSAKFRFF